MKFKTTVQLDKSEMQTLERTQAILEDFCDFMLDTPNDRCDDCPMRKLCDLIDMEDPYNEDTRIYNIYEFFGSIVERIKTNGMAD